MKHIKSINELFGLNRDEDIAEKIIEELPNLSVLGSTIKDPDSYYFRFEGQYFVIPRLKNKGILPSKYVVKMGNLGENYDPKSLKISNDLAKRIYDLCGEICKEKFPESPTKEFRKSHF